MGSDTTMVVMSLITIISGDGDRWRAKLCKQLKKQQHIQLCENYDYDDNEENY